MAETLTDRVKRIEKEREEKRTELVRLDERIKSYKEDEAQLTKELEATGLTEANAEAKLAEKETQIKETLDKVEAEENA